MAANNYSCPLVPLEALSVSGISHLFPELELRWQRSRMKALEMAGMLHFVTGASWKKTA